MSVVTSTSMLAEAACLMVFGRTRSIAITTTASKAG